MRRWWHALNIHLVLTSGKKLCLVECVGSLGTFYWFWLCCFFSLSLFSGWLNRRNKGQLPPLCCCCRFSFQAVFYTNQFLCCCTAAFWFGFVFQSTCKSIETKSSIYKCCGFYENIIKHISNKAHQSTLLFCYFSPLALQMAFFISTTKFLF